MTEMTGGLPLSWAQHNVWEYLTTIGDEARSLNLRLHTPVHGRTVEQVIDGLRRFVSAHDVARTTFGATTEQVIMPEGDVPIRFGESATGLLDALAKSAFAPDEPPIRFGIVADGDRARSIVSVHSHLAFDAFSMPMVSRLLERGSHGVVEDTIQLAELVRLEGSERMRARSDATLRRWSGTLSALPAGRGFRTLTEGSYTEWALHSRAVAVATQVLAARAGVSTTSVVLAALSNVLRSMIQDPPAAMLLISHNRHYPVPRRFAGITAQNALHVIPEASDFNAFVKRTHESAVRGYTRSRYDSARWRAMLAEMTARGTAPDLSYYFNDARATPAWDGLEHQLDTLRSWRASGSSVQVVQRQRLRDATLFFNLMDSGGAARMHLLCDDSVIPPTQAVAVLYGLEEYLVRQSLA